MHPYTCLPTRQGHSWGKRVRVMDIHHRHPAEHLLNTFVDLSDVISELSIEKAVSSRLFSE